MSRFTQPVFPRWCSWSWQGHKLFYEAYNDASDLNSDGALDVGYNPAI